MGGNVDDPEAQRMVEERYYRSLEINPRRARFPCGIAWTPLPVISWLIPFIGDIGICREDGIILDFGGPNFVCVDNFAFGAVARYIQINKDKDCSVSHYSSGFEGGDQYKPDATGSKGLTWDDALHKITQEFQHHSYSLFTCNCHSFVANNLNCLGFCSGRWNVVNLATLMFLKGRWVSAAAMVRSYFPFVIVCGLGFIVGDLSFLKFLAFITFLLFGWFLLGTYCFKNLIQL